MAELEAAPRPADDSGSVPLVERLFSPLHRFAGIESAGGIVLLVATALALIWANSPWAAAYHHLWETPVSVSVGGRTLGSTLHHLINDGLMAVFFFLVGMELKREVVEGHLSSLRRASLPAFAAAGERLGILIGSLASGLLGNVVLRPTLARASE